MAPACAMAVRLTLERAASTASAVAAFICAEALRAPSTCAQRGREGARHGAMTLIVARGCPAWREGGCRSASALPSTEALVQRPWYRGEGTGGGGRGLFPMAHSGVVLSAHLDEAADDGVRRAGVDVRGEVKERADLRMHALRTARAQKRRRCGSGACAVDVGRVRVLWGGCCRRRRGCGVRRSPRAPASLASLIPRGPRGARWHAPWRARSGCRLSRGRGPRRRRRRTAASRGRPPARMRSGRRAHGG